MDLRRALSVPEIDPGQFEDEGAEAAEAAAEAEALAQFDRGEGIPHEEIVAWLKTSGTTEEQPAPDEWRR